MTTTENTWWCHCGQTTREGPLKEHVYAPCCRHASWYSEPMYEPHLEPKAEEPETEDLSSSDTR